MAVMKPATGIVPPFSEQQIRADRCGPAGHTRVPARTTSRANKPDGKVEDGQRERSEGHAAIEK